MAYYATFPDGKTSPLFANKIWLAVWLADSINEDPPVDTVDWKVDGENEYIDADVHNWLASHPEWEIHSV